MNRYTATVQEIQTLDIITYIHIKINNTTLHVIRQNKPQWIDGGDELECSFQEANVSLSKNCPGRVSIENCLNAKFVSMRQTESLCEITCDSDIGEVVSLITANAFEKLGLQEGDDVTLLLRAVDMKLEPVLTKRREEVLQ
jgi:molybdopterin-binding protein